MKLFGTKVRIANIAIRKKKDAVAVVEAGATKADKARTTSQPRRLSIRKKMKPKAVVEEGIDNAASPPLSTRKRQLSPLSILVTEFIANNARKTHDSIEDEKQRNDFVFDLHEALRLVREGTGRPPRRSLSPASSVIDFFAETTESTLESIEDEKERIDFEEYLTIALRKSFRIEMR
jgi:hypothetical protein